MNDPYTVFSKKKKKRKNSSYFETPYSSLLSAEAATGGFL